MVKNWGYLVVCWRLGEPAGYARVDAMQARTAPKGCEPRRTEGAEKPILYLAL